MITEYLSYLQEQTKDDILYHGSIHQGLKYIDPKESQYQIKYTKRVFGADNKTFGAIFAMPWKLLHLRNGVNCKSNNKADMRNCETWVIEITKRNIKKFRGPCSLYHLKADNWVRPKLSSFLSLFIGKYTNLALPEYYTFGRAKVVKEEKYKSIKECYIKNGVKFKYVGVTPNYKPSSYDVF